MSEHNQVRYIADVAYKAGFVLLANIFIAQLYNSLSSNADGLHIIQSIIYKPELKRT